MARHSFIQMSKLSNVKGRISYISDPKRQEYLYATFSTREDMTFWNDLAKECQEEFKRFGTEGKCIEARELIIALPEEYTKFDPNQVLREFTEQFKKRYDVECVSALHHNKTKKNYHIHLIFSERRLLPEPEVKIATRSVFYDELGKRVRTKKEIPGEDGQIREGCIVIKKGEAYEKHLFTAKDEVFKNELFLDEAKQFYTALINRHIHDPERRLKVFDPNSVYLPTKKIGKNNPKEAEIEADNAARQDWNRTADMALVSGIEESKIIEIRNEHVYDEATRSVQKHGWLPGLFRGIIQKAKEILQVLIRETEIPPKPTLSVDMAEYRTMQKLMVKVQDEARAMFFSFVANHALAIQHEDERFARSGVFGQFGARIKGHDNKLHLVVMHDIHVDDLAVLIGDNFCQSENFTRLDCLVHDIAPPDRNFCINSTFRCSYSHRCIFIPTII